jgi:23S rRNA (uridine2552-2'-O)-methyltransferase
MKRRSSKWADHYARKAQKDNYPARSVYKLQEIQKKTGVLRKGDRVLDLGCAPGSWTIFAAETVGSGGKVVGVDLKPVAAALPANARAVTGDLLEPDAEIAERLSGPYDVVLSDMAPATTGNKTVDAARSFVLAESALERAKTALRPGGSFVCKIFQGPDFEEFLKQIKAGFDRHKIYKPQSSRKASREIFIIGMGKKEEE